MRHSTRNLEYVGFPISATQRFAMDDMYEDMEFVYVPLSTFGYAAHGKIYHDLMATETFGRIRMVSQTGGLDMHPFYGHARGTRAGHSLLTAVLAEVVGERLGIPYDEIKHLIAAGLYHDSAITPFSDFGNPQVPLTENDPLSEERNIDVVLNDGVLRVFKKYGIDRDRVIDIIRGNGGLINSRGSLDLDRISYTMYDYMRVIGGLPYGKFLDVLRPDLFDIDLDVRLVNGEFVFSDADRLARFLHLRALMFEHIYFDPNVKAREAFFRKALRDMIDRGLMTPRDFQGDDVEFESKLRKVMGLGDYRDIFMNSDYPFREVARIRGIKLETLKTLEDEETIVEESKEFDPATNTKVLSGGEVKPIRDVDPRAKEVEKIAKEQGYVGVYVRNGNLPHFIHPDALDDLF